MTGRTVASALALLCLLLVASCDRASRKASASGSSSADSGVRVSPAASSLHEKPPLGVHQPGELVKAATEVVHFLRGDVDFDRIRLADTVALYLGREEGGTRSEVPREMLRNPSSWKVHSSRLRSVYSFAPAKGPAELTTRVGRHLVCNREIPLASSFQKLAQLPHVGTALIYGNDSCLQSWNLTLIFDPRRKPPTVIAAVYDQYEW